MGGEDTELLHGEVRNLVSQKKTKVVIDLSRVEWVNSSGLGALLSCLTTIRRNGGELKLAHLTEKIQSLITITRLTQIFDTYESVEQAIRSFKK